MNMGVGVSNSDRTEEQMESDGERWRRWLVTRRDGDQIESDEERWRRWRATGRGEIERERHGKRGIRKQTREEHRWTKRDQRK